MTVNVPRMRRHLARQKQARRRQRVGPALRWVGVAWLPPEPRPWRWDDL